MSNRLLLALALFMIPCAGHSIVRIRIFSAYTPESVVFSVNTGSYELDHFNGERTVIMPGKPVIITKYEGKLAVKSGNDAAYICDSVYFRNRDEDCRFSVRINGKTPVKRDYSGNLTCYPDLETIVLVSNIEPEAYIAGVVKAEGGSGKNIEYFRTQAVIARTYLYRHLGKHISDRYNLCDETHCQVFRGLTSDPVITSATLSTAGQVIIAPDSILIISAFHSNCGGQTASSEDVWLSPQPYLRSISDPHCTESRNARWEKTVPLSAWTGYLKKAGLKDSPSDPSGFNYVQLKRQTDYRTGSFTVPLKSLRTDFSLRSTFFSVATSGENVVLKGRGYGHGVGLCQEGAMAMAAKGITYKNIIGFYYPGVIIADIAVARQPEDDVDPADNFIQPGPVETEMQLK